MYVYIWGNWKYDAAELKNQSDPTVILDLFTHYLNILELTSKSFSVLLQFFVTLIFLNVSSKVFPTETSVTDIQEWRLIALFLLPLPRVLSVSHESDNAI